MPASKYKPRSQRNRRRLGSAKFVIPTTPIEVPDQVTVVAAGQAAVNGAYTLGTPGIWTGPTDTEIYYSQNRWEIRLVGVVQYYADQFPNTGSPPLAGWQIDSGAGPAPTVTIP